jgi:formylmethanofuran dehydrogenase subunit E
MSNTNSLKSIATCDICHGEVMEQDGFRLVNDLLYCPECYEAAVHEGRIETDDE